MFQLKWVYSTASFLLDRIPHDNTSNLLGKLKYRKGSGRTVNKAASGREGGGVEEGDRKGVKSVTQPKKPVPRPRCQG